MMQQKLEDKVVTKKEFACDGDGGALGHPRVFLNMGSKSETDCPYCGRLFKLAS